MLKLYIKNYFIFFFFFWLEKILYLSFSSLSQRIFSYLCIKEFYTFSKIHGFGPTILLIFYIFQSNFILLIVRKIIISHKKRFKSEN